MTKAARISQADVERALRAARKSAPGSRVIVDLARQRVEIVLSVTESVDDDDNPWDPDDGAP